MQEEYNLQNRDVWDAWTLLHYESPFYDVEGFLRGASSLNSLEQEEIGEVRGRRVLHLQCHFGLDTLSLARLGAQVTGVDFSSESIAKAMELAERAGLEARFIHSDIYTLHKVLDEQFDIVFTSYGVLNWLHDIRGWARCIASFLGSGGMFYMVEFHPILWTMDAQFEKIAYPYDAAEAIGFDFEGSYAVLQADVRGTMHCWNHGLGSVCGALREVGLKIDMLREHPFSPYNIFPRPVEVKDGWWAIEGLQDKIPMLYSVRATW